MNLPKPKITHDQLIKAGSYILIFLVGMGVGQGISTHHAIVRQARVLHALYCTGQKTETCRHPPDIYVHVQDLPTH